MTTHLLALGVNDYPAPVRSLKCCHRDAREMVSVFKERFGFNAQLIETATLESVVSHLRQLESALVPGDVFLFYFSGHGKSHQDDHFLLLPDVDLDDLAEATGGRSEFGAISYLHLKRQTARPAWRGVKRLFILDACRTPIIEDKGRQNEVFDSKFLLKDIGLTRRVRITDQTAGLTVVNSCDQGASASELEEAGHGLFTAAFLERARRDESESGALIIDKRFCLDLETDMSRMAIEARMPRSVWHRPVIGGAPVELRSTRNACPANESIEWEICQARLSIESLERFIRSFPGSVHKREALLILSRLSNDSLPAAPPRLRTQPEHFRKPNLPMATSADNRSTEPRKVSLYPPRAALSPPTGTLKPTAPARLGNAQPPKTEAAQPPEHSPTLTAAEAAKRDERLWMLALGEPTLERFEQYLQEASSDAPMRQAASAKLKQLRRSDPTPKTTEPTRRDSPRAGRPLAGVSRNSEWNPEPAPDFKLSLDKAANLLSGKNRR